MPLAQTVTVINKSGKVVTTGKQLASVFKEAKAAYHSRKAEIKSVRQSETKSIKKPLHSDENLRRHAGEQSVHRSRSTAHRRRHSPHDDDRADNFARKPLARGHTDSVLGSEVVYAHPTHPPSFELPDRPLIRRNTTQGARPRSSSSFDEHLAYGSMPPPLPQETSDEVALRNKFWDIKNLMDEANCMQHSAAATIEHLQKNPDALAAVGLALAEASTLATKVGPIALASLKTSFPAVIALLASPQFLIAAGLGLGVTVVMLGGYKIIKHVKETKRLKAAGEDEDEMVPMQYIEGEVKLPPIEAWRRGIADAAASSVGTTVDGEFVTPGASKQLIESGAISASQVHPTSERTGKSKSKHGRSHRRASKSGSVASKSRRGDDDTSSKASSKAGSKSGSVKDGKRKKAVSGLKMLFQGRAPPT